LSVMWFSSRQAQGMLIKGLELFSLHI